MCSDKAKILRKQGDSAGRNYSMASAVMKSIGRLLQIAENKFMVKIIWNIIMFKIKIFSKY